MSGFGAEIKLAGFEQIKDALRILPDNLRNQALRAGVVDGAREIRNIAKIKVRKRTGRLAKDITAQARRGSKDEVLASVGWKYGKGHSNVGHLIEFGHRIVSRNGKEGGFVPAFPHLRPALDEGKWRAIRAIRLTAKRAIENFGRGLTARGRARK